MLTLAGIRLEFIFFAATLLVLPCFTTTPCGFLHGLAAVLASNIYF